MNLNCETFDSMLLAMGPFSESERSIINYALDLREAVRVLGQVVSARQHRDSLVNGDACQLIMAVPPMDRENRVTVAVREFAAAEIAVMELEDAVSANPIAAAAVEAARNQTKGTQ